MSVLNLPQKGEQTFASNFLQSYRISELPPIIKVGRTKIYAEIKRGNLKSFKCGRSRIVAHCDLISWQAELQRTSTSSKENS